MIDLVFDGRAGAFNKVFESLWKECRKFVPTICLSCEPVQLHGNPLGKRYEGAGTERGYAVIVTSLPASHCEAPYAQGLCSFHGLLETEATQDERN